MYTSAQYCDKQHTQAASMLAWTTPAHCPGDCYVLAIAHSCNPMWAIIHVGGVFSYGYVVIFWHSYHSTKIPFITLTMVPYLLLHQFEIFADTSDNQVIFNELSIYSIRVRQEGCASFADCFECGIVSLNRLSVDCGTTQRRVEGLKSAATSRSLGNRG